jgi:hypothetical protein
MITVKIDVEPTKSYSLRELLGKSSDKNAFIGRCGNGPASLYIIGLTGIFLAEDPRRFWNSPNCSVVVTKFVDLVITVKDDSIPSDDVDVIRCNLEGMGVDLSDFFGCDFVERKE